MSQRPTNLLQAVLLGFECSGRSDVEVGLSVEQAVRGFLCQRFALSYMRAETYAPDIAAGILAELERLAKDLKIRPADAYLDQIRTDLRDNSRGTGI